MDAFFEALLKFVFYGIGRLIITMVTLGWVRGEGINETLEFPWYGFTRDADGKPVASSGCCALTGGLALAGALIAFVVLYTG